MAQTFPFRAYRYSRTKADPARVLTQPYDKITPEMQKRYAATSPYNLVTIEKGIAQPDDTPANNVYTRAAQALKDWIAEGVLARDPEPAFYAYFQESDVPGTGDHFIRKGLIALSRIEDYSAGVVFRHEQTFSGPKADRLELLRQTRAHTGQLFMLYDDPTRRVDAILDRVASAPPTMDVRDEFGVLHYLWRIAQREIIAEIEAALRDAKLVIADGHHRYETAMAYRDEQREAARKSGRPQDPNAPYERVMMTLVNSRDEGLVILPGHRVLSGLSGFDYEAFLNRLTGSATDRGATVREALAEAVKSGPVLGVYAGGDRVDLLTVKPNADLAAALPGISPRQRQLDVVLLHDYILAKGLGLTAETVRREQNIRYQREAAAAMSAVAEGRAQVCFLLNPVRVEQVMEIALAGEVMPQKSTDFYPKMLSGMAIYRLDD
jgi:uncharacterized protein (DUF1015 family)